MKIARKAAEVCLVAAWACRDCRKQEQKRLRGPNALAALRKSRCSRCGGQNLDGRSPDGASQT